ncbi:MAG TPA: RDD family protein [Longimicrobiaceae bacterium]|nr:RDD family protein [Longimicrobiaceae bacterium]
MSSQHVDPRSIVTPDAFSVAPHLLGLPLASARRRAAAMAVDLLVVAFLVNVGGAVLFGLAVAWVFFRVATRRQGTRVLPRALRVGFGVLGAVVLFAAATSLWDRVQDGFGRDEAEGSTRDAARAMRLAARAVGGEGAAALRAGADLLALREAESEQEAFTLASGFATRMRAAGTPEAEVRDALREVAEEAESDEVKAGVRRVLAGEGGAVAPPPAPDSLVRAYAAALEKGDTAGADSLRPRVTGVLAADTLGALRRELAALNGDNRRLEAELEEERETVGLLGWLGKVADEMGIGFGWTGLYFTAFLALWRGQTPGKRMLGIRVVRLDGRPIGWWAAFERFGGYAASIFTGLLGFFQILWDRNRQALHDKVTETVVVREGEPRPAS